tara:strand:+ start:213 stop:1952 length:1740 start_codon:yes stop_codon:yes gene_type:complete
MRQGGEDLLRQFNKGTDYIQSSFASSEGIFNKNVPNFIYKGIVIDVNFDRIAPTTTASMVPPFSVYAKIIGMDEDVAFPETQPNRIYYPPLFPIHNLCIPEIGEEILILKESSEESSVGYYIGRVNDSTPLNISYARDYIATNDTATNNQFRYGFSFDVRKLRKKYEHLMPSDENNNISIPLIFGDVVQQGRSKTYLRHSFNRNNKKGVLEQGITLPGQSAGTEIKNNFNYVGVGANNKVFDNATITYNYLDEETQEVMQQTDVVDPNYGLPKNKQFIQSFDPSIGETSTKTIHFVDSSIIRLGNYSFQSEKGEIQSDLQAEDRSIIANIADEIYNISSKEISGALYRQVLGEKLVNQQQQTYSLLKEVLTTVQGFAQTTQVLLDAFIDHTHALPKIELNLEKEIKSKDLYRSAAKIIPQPDQIIRVPAKRIRVQTGTKTIEIQGRGPGGYGSREKTVPVWNWVSVPGSTFRTSSSPRIIPGRMKARSVKQKINFEAIIGGKENPRFTAPVQLDVEPEDVTAPLFGIEETKTLTELGEKTATVNNSLEKAVLSFENQQENLDALSLKIANFLSKHQFVN